MTWAEHAPIHELRVELVDTQPSIWRTLRIPSNATLGDLHVVLQTVMGWTNSHMHEFQVGAKRYGIPDPEGDDFGPPARDEDEYCIVEVLKKPKQKLTYVYDFGDNWRHIVTLVAIHPNGPELECLAGERACPPDDCGGTYGFDRLLEILANPKHPEHQDMTQWLSEMKPDGYDPAVFDRAAVNTALADGIDGLRDFFDDLAGEWDEDEDDTEADDGKVIPFPKGKR